MDKNQANQINHTNQLNPSHIAYYQSRGNNYSTAVYNASHNKTSLDNHSNQLNPNNSRCYSFMK